MKIGKHGATVCTSAFDIVQRLELVAIERRAAAEGVDAINTMVRSVSVYDVHLLEGRSCRNLSLEERSEAGGIYDKMQSTLDLVSLEDCYLVALPI